MIALNEAARFLLRCAVVLAGHVLSLQMKRHIRGYVREQARLKQRYGIGPGTPILTWGDEVRASVERFAAAHPDARFAYTSGSTAMPKKIAFTPRRVRSFKRGSFSIVARMIARRPHWRAGLFIFSSLDADDSFTSLILNHGARMPPWLTGLVMPARYLAAPAVAELVQRYGATATRVWLMALCNPGIIYSTNPSTLAVFLGELRDQWTRSTALVRAHHQDAASIGATLDPVIARVAAPGWRARFARIAASPEPLPLAEWADGLSAYCCWDGGYVRPFLDELARHLPSDRFQFVPMYSMSTETVETLNHFDGEQVRFLPIAPGVLYEFLPEGAADDPGLLVPADALEPGRVYSMVVSDPYGLTRYQTEDLFLCRARVGNAPDLVFLRRRGLTYSFTGEKLTDAQLGEAFEALRLEVPALREAAVQLACFPSRPSDGPLPCYRLVLACPGRQQVDAAPAAARFDAILARINREFASKLTSGRLGATRAVAMSYDALVAQLGGKTQFKLLPLYRKTWEEYGFDSH